MKLLQFKCTLLSDLIINSAAATEGEQTTLDFIPGNNFLGIVAAGYNRFSPAEQMEIFHSGNVRFGDAHPTMPGCMVRSLHVPASFFYPKGKQPYEECHAFQGYDRQEDARKNGRPMQLKQCRSGYYVFSDKTGKPIPTEKSFAIKSAYERDLRRSEDNKMYGYESLNKGQAFLFEVEVDNDQLSEKIHTALLGIQRIGRSRTAQYGLVNIEDATFSNIGSHATPVDTIHGKRVAVYADSRLIFLDSTGQPKTQIEASDLGLDGTIDWQFCQIRTFQYASWNGKRQTRDADRYGIEKGSVFFVNCKEAPSESQFVGNYKHEGFGRVIYNPDFITYDGNLGKTSYQLLKAEENDSNEPKTSLSLSGTPLLNYLNARRAAYIKEMTILARVNDFVAQNKALFQGKIFASQWGQIRNIAMTHPTMKAIAEELFEKKKKLWHSKSPSNNTEGYKEEPAAYLTHGIAKDKWERGGRREKLRKFIDNFKDNPDYVQEAVINLASEMAKIRTRNERN